MGVTHSCWILLTRSQFCWIVHYNRLFYSDPEKGAFLDILEGDRGKFDIQTYTQRYKAKTLSYSQIAGKYLKKNLNFLTRSHHKLIQEIHHQ